ncbi:MAG: glycogen debranching protein GlgX [Shewanella sp.]
MGTRDDLGAGGRVWQLTQGQPFPLGASVDANGVNFALFSAHASAVELCLFDDSGSLELGRFRFTEYTQQIWHGYVRGLKAGQLYGYRVYGPFAPEQGHRFNPHKLLLDPYARQLVGEYQPNAAHYSYILNDPDEDLSFSTLDNAAFMPKCKVVDTRALRAATFVHPSARRPLAHTILYEMHLKGFTAANPELDGPMRGTFAALASAPAIAYLVDLGVTCVELMPIQAFVTEAFLQENGLSNYWGYNTLGFFAPEPSYLLGEEIGEFRAMVDALHRAGIEVILDVVYNHSAEGNRLGPTLSFRGIDNLSYYRLHPQDKRSYINDTGCGNTLNINHPRVLQLVLDSLRYWVEVMGVDGFRFDLATCLGREHYGFDPGAGFFDALLQDPLLCQVKLIAEPWDLGPGGYQLGNFPVAFSEWNDTYRDTLRRFWRGDAGMLPEFARRFHGSADVFEASGRPPAASINFITSHDGFTLKDLVSYAARHNQANGEDNRDGHRHNFSDNYGVEGPSCTPAVLGLRYRQQRNLLTCLLLSQGVPMLLCGDEVGRSQRGNNNAYCQDNPLSWFDWAGMDRELLAFTKQLIALRKRFALLCSPRFIHEQLLRASPFDEAEMSHLASVSHSFASASQLLTSASLNLVTMAAPSLKSHDPLDSAATGRLDWFNPEGQPMGKGEWAEPSRCSLSLVLSGDLALNGEPQALLLMVNAGDKAQRFTLPVAAGLGPWHCLLHTQYGELTSLAAGTGAEANAVIEPEPVHELRPQRGAPALPQGPSYLLQDRSLMLFHAPMISPPKNSRNE